MHNVMRGAMRDQNHPKVVFSYEARVGPGRIKKKLSVKARASRAARGTIRLQGGGRERRTGRLRSSVPLFGAKTQIGGLFRYS